VCGGSSPGGSLRGSAQNLGIPAITVEIGDPSKLQFGMIRKAYQGVYNILTFLNMLTDEGDARPPIVKVTLCTSSRWYFTDTGGNQQSPARPPIHLAPSNDDHLMLRIIQ
jgi:predicted deacylase